MSSELKVDTISEKTSAAGVTIDGVLIKDGNVDGVDVSGITSNPAFTIIDSYKLNGDLSGTGDITSFTDTANTSGAEHNLGSSMSVDGSGIFTFPETGIYEITVSFDIGKETDGYECGFSSMKFDLQVVL